MQLACEALSTDSVRASHGTRRCLRAESQVPKQTFGRAGSDGLKQYRSDRDQIYSTIYFVLLGYAVHVVGMHTRYEAGE